MAERFLRVNPHKPGRHHTAVTSSVFMKRRRLKLAHIAVTPALEKWVQLCPVLLSGQSSRYQYAIFRPN